MKAIFRPVALAALALASAAAPAAAWEVIGAGGEKIPTFAASFRASGEPAPLPGFAPGKTDGGAPQGLGVSSLAGASGYDFRVGKNFLVGVDTKSGFATRDSFGFGFAPGLDVSRTTMKFGYDMGAFKPFVSAGVAEARSSFGINAFNYVGAVATNGSPFAPTARATSVGAGFDYAVTDKLSVGVSVNAVQTSGGAGWR